MKNKFVQFILLLVFSAVSSYAQEAETKLYNPQANAKEDIAIAIMKAKSENKMVLIQAGGNWCKWCIEFNRFCKADAQIDSMLKADFVVYHLNYSKENKNPETMADMEYPQRFGFPVFVILDQNGNRVHTQNSSYLEEDKSYSKVKIMEFLKQWNRKALLPETYK